MILHVGSCLDVNGGNDPLGICQAQANAYCANHSHGGGGGGGQRIEPNFMIEEREQSIVAITEFDTSDLDAEQRRLLTEILTAGVEAQKARQRQVMARFRMHVASESEESQAE